MRRKNKVIIITGPCGVGKTSVANVLIKKISAVLINGDKLKQNLFPDIDYIQEHPQKLQILKKRIFELCKEHFLDNKSVVIDYVILGKDYISLFQQTFGENLIFRVILPKKKVIYQRDQSRACWTSGREIIDKLYDKYVDLMDIIGENNYLDNENETPEETAQTILENISLKKEP